MPLALDDIIERDRPRILPDIFPLFPLAAFPILIDFVWTQEGNLSLQPYEGGDQGQGDIQ